MRAWRVLAPHHAVDRLLRARERHVRAYAPVIAIAAMLASVLAFPAPAEASAKKQYSGRIFAIGDSVMIGARTCLEARRYTVDAVGSRQISAGIETLRARRSSLPKRVVVHLGTNGGAYPADLDRVVKAIGRKRLIIFVTIQLPNNYSRYTFEERTNAAIRELPERYDNVRVFDWNAITNNRPHLFWADGFHVNPKGCASYAKRLDNIARARR